MHQIDLYVDILYIPHAFLAHRSDTGTTNGPNTDPKPWILCVSGTAEKCTILCRGRECRFRAQHFGTGS